METITIRSRGGARINKLIFLSALMSQVRRCESIQEELFEEIGNGWIIRRAEEIAIFKCSQHLLNIGSKWLNAAKKAYDVDQYHANSRLYSSSGQILKAADQLQLVILKGLMLFKACCSSGEGEVVGGLTFPTS